MCEIIDGEFDRKYFGDEGYRTSMPCGECGKDARGGAHFHRHGLSLCPGCLELIYLKTRAKKMLTNAQGTG